MTRPNFNWHIGGATTIGATHTRRGMVNQDSYTVFTSDDSNHVIGAVADGHGAAPHFRSERGSKFATDVSVDILKWMLETSDPCDLEEVKQDILNGWKDAVLQDFDLNFQDLKGASELTPYGSTLLAFCANEESLTVLQLGDGDLVVGTGDTVSYVFAEDEGLQGEQTYSLCIPGSIKHFQSCQFNNLSDGDVQQDFVLLATDGVSKSYRSNDDFLEVASQYRERCLRSSESFDKTIAALPDWLADLTARGSGDDTTMVIAAKLQTYEGNII